MIDTPTIIETTAQATAVVRLTIPRAEIRTAMGPAREEVLAAVSAQGIGPAGPWFSRHLRMDPAVFDFEVGVPVSAPVTPGGRVIAGELPATRVARAVLRGGYEQLGAAWGELDAWVKAQGHAVEGSLWEIYASGPDSSENPSEWRTELYRPLAR